LIDGNFNAAIYLDLLQNEVISAIENIFNENTQNIWFQQDGDTWRQGHTLQ